MCIIYFVCYCDNEVGIENEVICLSDKIIVCDVF